MGHTVYNTSTYFYQDKTNIYNKIAYKLISVICTM